MVRGIRLGLVALVVGVGVCGCGDPQEKAIRVLHEGGYDFSVSDYLRAAAEGKRDVVEMFHRSGMAVDAADHAGNTALLKAAELGHGELVGRLLELGADGRRVGPSGETILMLGARSGDAETVRLLLEAGADPTRKTADNWTAVTIAAIGGHADVVAELAPRSGEQVDSALQVAAMKGDSEVVDVLLNHGASVFARSPENRTALMYAAQNGHLEIVRLLMRNGANRFALDAEDLTAAQLASAAGHVGVFEYLSQAEVPEEVHVASGGHPADAFGLHGRAFAVPDAGADPDAPAGGAVVESLPAIAGAGAAADPIAAGTPGPWARTEPAVAEPVVPRLDGAVVAATVVGAPEAGAASTFTDAGSGVAAAPSTGRGNTVDPDRTGAEVPPAPASTGRFPARAPEAGVAAADPGSVPSERVEPSRAGVAAAATGGGATGVAQPAAPELREIVRMEQYGEKPLPVMLADVPAETDEAGGESVAEVRVLTRANRAPVRVAEGETVPDTRLRVVSVERKFTYSKQGKGDLVNVSRMVVEDTETGKRHLVVKDIPAASSQTAAIMRVGDQERYEVQPDDQFQVAGDAASDYRVLEVRPTQIIIENLTTGDVITVERFRVTGGR